MSDAHTQMIWTLLCGAEEHVKTKGRTKIKKKQELVLFAAQVII